MRSPIETLLAATERLDAIIVVDGGDYGDVIAATLKRLIGAARTFEGTVADARRKVQSGEVVRLIVVREAELSFEQSAALREWAVLGIKIVALVDRRPRWSSGLAVIWPAQRDLGPAGRALLCAGLENREVTRRFCAEFNLGHPRSAT